MGLFLIFEIAFEPIIKLCNCVDDRYRATGELTDGSEPLKA